MTSFHISFPISFASDAEIVINLGKEILSIIMLSVFMLENGELPLLIYIILYPQIWFYQL